MALSELSVGDTCRVYWCIGYCDSGRTYVADGWFNETLVLQSGVNTLRHASSYWSGKYDTCNLSTSSCTIYLANADGTPYFNVTYYEVYIYKVDPAWVAVKYPYKKINGVWVLQTDASTVFDSTKGYIRGDNPAEQ